MTTKLNPKQAAKVQSIEAALKDALVKVKALNSELSPSEGLVWNPSFKRLLRSHEIVIRQMQRMNAAIEKLKQEANR